MKLVEGDGDMQSASRVTDQDNFTDGVDKARVPNLRAERKSARRGDIETALEEEREKVKDES